MEKIELENGITIGVGTKEEAFWREIQEQAKKELERAEESHFKIITFQKAVIELAKDKLKTWETS